MPINWEPQADRLMEEINKSVEKMERIEQMSVWELLGSSGEEKAAFAEASASKAQGRS